MEFGSGTVHGPNIYQVDIVDIALLHQCLNHFMNCTSRVALHVVLSINISTEKYRLHCPPSKIEVAKSRPICNGG